MSSSVSILFVISPHFSTPCSSRHSHFSITLRIPCYRVSHALLITRVIIIRPKKPWYNSELSDAKRQPRRGERRWRQTRLLVHRDIYTSLRDVYRENWVAAKSSFFCEKIRKSACDVNAMYRITNEITGRKNNHQCYPNAAILMMIRLNVFKYISPKRLRMSAVQCIITTPHYLCCHLTTITSPPPLYSFNIHTHNRRCYCSTREQMPFKLLRSSSLADETVKNKLKYDCTSASGYHQYLQLYHLKLIKRWSLSCSRRQVWTQMRSMISALHQVPDLPQNQHVAVDLRRYIDENKPIDHFQSAYRPHHSTEIALVRIHDDIM